MRRWFSAARRSRVLILGGLALVLLAYGLVAGSRVIEVREFRRHPSRSVAEKLLAGDWPHQVLGRAFMFKRGTDLYEKALQGWVYRDRSRADRHPLSDTPWNRWILERDLLALEKDELGVYLPRYPLTPGPRLHSAFAAELVEGNVAVLAPLSRARNKNLPFVAAWLRDSVVTPRKLNLLQKVPSSALFHLPSLSGSSFAELVDAFDPPLSQREFERLLRRPAHDAVDAELASELLHYLDRQLDAEHLRPSATILGSFGWMAAAAEDVDRALEIVAEHLAAAPALAVRAFYGETPCPAALPAEAKGRVRSNAQRVLRFAAEQVREPHRGRAALAIEAFRHLARCDLQEAERVAAPILDGPDSELRKGVIVLLVRHRSDLGRRLVDDAFRGTAPRRTMFSSVYQYVYSDAAARYAELAGHDYLETGKAWPPEILEGGPVEPEAWLAFIEEYPWFPGTDDAYYRMAFTQYQQGDYQNALRSVEEFIAADLPDLDATAFVLRVAQAVGTADPPALRARPRVAALLTLMNRPIGDAVIAASPDLGALSSALDELLREPPTTGLLAQEQAHWMAMRALIEIIASRPPEERGLAAYPLLSDEAIDLRKVMYGQVGELYQSLSGFELGQFDVDARDRLGNRLLEIVRGARGDPSRKTELVNAVAWTLIHEGTDPFGQLYSLYMEVAEVDVVELPAELQASFCSLQRWATGKRSPDCEGW